MGLSSSHVLALKWLRAKVINRSGAPAMAAGDREPNNVRRYRGKAVVCRGFTPPAGSGCVPYVDHLRSRACAQYRR